MPYSLPWDSKIILLHNYDSYYIANLKFRKKLRGVLHNTESDSAENRTQLRQTLGKTGHRRV